MKNLARKFPVWLDINEKTSRVLVGVAVFLVICLDYLLLMQFQFKALSAVTPKVAELSKQLTEVRYNLERLGLFQEEARKVREQLEKLNKSIIDKEEIPAVLERISRFTKQLDIRVEQIMPLGQSQEVVAEQDGVRYSALPIFVKGQSGYHNIGRFFNRVETDEIFMNIANFDVAQNSTHPRQHLFRATIIVFFREGSS